jgi:DNA-binding response OmpR family regulator
MQNILVIDDDTLVGGLLEAHLKDEGYQVQVVQRGDDGVAAATVTKPDLILLDVMLPDATGYQICKQLRTLVQNVPIIMMSGVARYANQKTYAMERGANDYLVKPFEIIEVGDLVHSYLRKDNQPPVAPRKTLEAKAKPEAKPVEQPPMAQAPALDEGSLDDVRRYLNNVLNNKGNP